ncbi:MAG: ABC transporter substrate-binding protein [Hyphomicrobiales bacterium]|jgi:peptide/nickel transport system substrate-binding protein|nr:ABC transporter substrate-binding protein [Hyphomicrobiales bacterium]
MISSRRTVLKAGTASLAFLAAPSIARAQANASNTLIWADDSNSDVTYDPRVTQSRHEEQVIVQVFDQLIMSDETGKLSPGLATAWEMSPDATSLRFTLRNDVKFHDGTPFNAEAVRFTLDSIVDPATGSQGAVDMLGPYDKTEILGPHEVRVHFKAPNAGAIDTFTENELSIVSPTAVQKLGRTGFAQAPVGTGPFRFVSWERGREVILDRNPDYAWAPTWSTIQGPSNVQRIVHRFIPNNATRVAALEAGEVHIGDILPALDTKRLSDSGRYRAMIGVAAGLSFGALLNTSRAPFDDIRVRQAFMHAIDRPRLAQNLYFGLIKAAYGPLAPSTPGYWSGAEQYFPFDRARANKLLDDAGWTMGPNGIRVKNGQPLRAYFPSLLLPDVAVALQSEARRVGFDIAVENVLKQRQDELLMTNQYEMAVIRWVSNDPGVLRIPFHSSNIPEPGKFKFNWSRVNDPALDGLIARATQAKTPAERTELFAVLQKDIMDRAIFFPIHDQVQTVAHTARVSGLRYARGNWQVRFHEARLATA